MESKFIPVSQIDERIREIELQLERLPIELDALRRLKATAVQVAVGSTAMGEPRPRPLPIPPSSGRAHGARPVVVGPTRAVLEYLRVHGPSTSSQIVEEARRNGVATATSNLDRLIQSTIYNLRNRGMVRRESGDRWAIVEQERKEIKADGPG